MTRKCCHEGLKMNKRYCHDLQIKIKTLIDTKGVSIIAPTCLTLLYSIAQMLNSLCCSNVLKYILTVEINRISYYFCT